MACISTYGPYNDIRKPSGLEMSLNRNCHPYILVRIKTCTLVQDYLFLHAIWCRYTDWHIVTASTIHTPSHTYRKCTYVTVQLKSALCFTTYLRANLINLLAPELFFLILAHTVYKMWIIQEPNKLELWNKLHFEEEKTESIYHV
jgi:hypothetical protein